MNRFFTSLFIFTALLGLVYFGYSADTVLASTTLGTIYSTDKYAWGASSGWINFRADNSNVEIGDDSLTGYLWSELYGWINLAPDGSGVKNDKEGILSGSAFGENTSWINFSGVKISSSGVFSGTASGDTTGTISFDCSGCRVTTDWRPVSIRTSVSVTGSFGSSYPSVKSDTEKPNIVITYIKDKYSLEEEVVIGGSTEPNSEISLDTDGKFGLFFADNQGNFLINLNEKSLGKHIIKLTAKDPSENVGNALTVEFTVETGPAPQKSAIIEKIRKEIKKIIPPIFQTKEKKHPQLVITVPRVPPTSFRLIWNLLPVKAIKSFVLSPLPTEIKLLAQKFPELEKTFKNVGITKITDIKKLRIANLKIPGLAQTLGSSQVEIRPGEFTPPKGISFASLPIITKQKIPAGIVFATAGGGLVDLNVVLSVDDKGKLKQTIKTISGKQLQLVVKPDRPVRKVKGYVIFKSKKPTPTSFQIPLNYFAASLMFASPNFIRIQSKPVNVEEKLVLMEFEYQDTGGGVYIATVQFPIVDGEYEVITVMDYEDTAVVSKEIKLITVVDPEGYIYEKNGNKETRILGAIVSLYWLSPDTKQYELWPAQDYQQENSQITDVRGTYSFLVPKGFYYIKVDAPGYLSYDSKPFLVAEGSGVHINIELKNRYWWTKIVDWKTVLLITVILLLLYNFYRDKMREKIIVQGKV